MKKKLVILLAALLVAVIISLCHELPKAFVYRMSQKKKRKMRHLFKVQHYIDPIGLLFQTICYAGFSKPYLYGIKDKKTNLLIGIVGFLSLILCACVGGGLFYITVDYLNTPNLSASIYWQTFIYSFSYFFMLFPITMAMVNLFPISTFDISMVIAGINLKRYFILLSHETYVKILLLLVIMYGGFKNIGVILVNLFITSFGI
ncbi:MAG: hypothetical protein U0L23_08415 [Lachnospiraceae bacterium]|nr:hypothetical protein [Lachnospiraceae bacterium]MEE1342720.1 hypothetical protein [Lachnospiraceae bacterium]